MNWKMIIALLLVLGCSKEQMNDCFTSLGAEATVERNLDEFTSIYVEDRMEVELVDDSNAHGTITLIGPENLLPQIKTVVNDNELRITNNNTCNFVRSFKYSIKLRIPVKNLRELRTQSVARFVSTDTIRTRELYIYHSALSDIDLVLDADLVYVKSLNSAHTRLSGRARVMKGSIEEVSDVFAEELEVEEVMIDTHTPLDLYVNATKGLFVKIYNTGNIYYLSEPTDYKEVNVQRGTGQLLKRP